MMLETTAQKKRIGPDTAKGTEPAGDIVQHPQTTPLDTEGSLTHTTRMYPIMGPTDTVRLRHIAMAAIPLKSSLPATGTVTLRISVIRDIRTAPRSQTPPLSALLLGNLALQLRKSSWSSSGETADLIHKLHRLPIMDVLMAAAEIVRDTFPLRPTINPLRSIVDTMEDRYCRPVTTTAAPAAYHIRAEVMAIRSVARRHLDGHQYKPSQRSSTTSEICYCHSGAHRTSCSDGRSHGRPFNMKYQC